MSDNEKGNAMNIIRNETLEEVAKFMWQLGYPDRICDLIRSLKIKEYQPLFGLTAEEKEHAPPRTHDASGKRIDGYGDPAKGEYNAFLGDDGSDIPCD